IFNTPAEGAGRHAVQSLKFGRPLDVSRLEVDRKGPGRPASSAICRWVASREVSGGWTAWGGVPPFAARHASTSARSARTSSINAAFVFASSLVILFPAMEGLRTAQSPMALYGIEQDRPIDCRPYPTTPEPPAHARAREWPGSGLPHTCNPPP